MNDGGQLKSVGNDEAYISLLYFPNEIRMGSRDYLFYLGNLSELAAKTR